jgi:UDP-N-acetylmuramoyl-L-alanyl-D-glutamate--2,6-diaminopimelate ligase
MLLCELISAIKYEELRGDDQKLIKSITPDSRQVANGSVFVAISGPVADGHTFIGQALNNGAVAVVCEHIPENASAVGGIECRGVTPVEHCSDIGTHLKHA